jgi:hypothetical protein
MLQALLLIAAAATTEQLLPSTATRSSIAQAEAVPPGCTASNLHFALEGRRIHQIEIAKDLGGYGGLFL